MCEEIGREKWERLLLCWTRETARDLNSTATGTVGTLGFELGTWFVNSPDRQEDFTAR